LFAHEYTSIIPSIHLSFWNFEIIKFIILLSSVSGSFNPCVSTIVTSFFKYSIYEVPPRSSKLEENDFDFESTDEILKKSSIKKNDAGNTPYYEERRKTEPHLKEFFQDVEDENGEDIIENTGKEIITETKKLKKDIKTTEDVKVPIQRKNKNYHYEKYD